MLWKHSSLFVFVLSSNPSLPHDRFQSVRPSDPGSAGHSRIGKEFMTGREATRTPPLHRLYCSPDPIWKGDAQQAARLHQVFSLFHGDPLSDNFQHFLRVAAPCAARPHRFTSELVDLVWRDLSGMESIANMGNNVQEPAGPVTE